MPNPWVSFTFDHAIDTGIVMNATKAGAVVVRSRYLLILVGDRWLISDVPSGFAGNEIVGYLDTWSSPLSRKMIEQVKAKFPDRNIFPYQLNAQYDYKGQCFSMMGIAAFIYLSGFAVIGFAISDFRKINQIADQMDFFE